MPRRKVETPGEVVEGDLATVLGIVITDEARANFKEAMDAINAAEQKVWTDTWDIVIRGSVEVAPDDLQLV